MRWEENLKRMFVITSGQKQTLGEMIRLANEILVVDGVPEYIKESIRVTRQEAEKGLLAATQADGFLKAGELF